MERFAPLEARDWSDSLHLSRGTGAIRSTPVDGALAIPAALWSAFPQSASRGVPHTSAVHHRARAVLRIPLGHAAGEARAACHAGRPASPSIRADSPPLRSYLACRLLCYGFARGVCTTCRTGFVVAARLSRARQPWEPLAFPSAARQDGAMDGPPCLWPAARAAASARPATAATWPRLPPTSRITSSRPRLGGISFLHRSGSALNHRVHLHACVADGVFVVTPCVVGSRHRARPGADRGKRARNSRAAHQLAHRCGSAIGRAIHLAWGWVMHPAAADAPQPRLELRLRHGSDVWSSGVLDADDCGRVHAGVPCERRGSQVDERGCAGALSDLLFGVIAALAMAGQVASIASGSAINSCRSVRQASL